MTAGPVSWLRFRFQMQDSRVAGKDLKPYTPPYQDTFDLRIAYVEFGTGEDSPASLRVGRQELNLGEERLVGSSGWSNTARSFDAARLTLRRGRFNLDAFAASPVVLHDGDVGDHVAGNNLHGLYGGIQGVVPDAKIEPYVLWRLNQRQKTETGGIGNLDFTTVGLRWIGKLRGGFDYSFEMAHQQGSLGTDRIRAWAGHWVVGYALGQAMGSRLVSEFNYASGDSNSADGQRHTFDSLFAGAHDKYGLADQVGWKNIMHGRAGIEARPADRWTAASKLGAYWLADPHDAMYNSSGTAVVRKADGSAGRFVGWEFDSLVSYAVSRQFQTGAGYAHLFPGEFLHRTTPGRGYNCFYLMLTAGL